MKIDHEKRNRLERLRSSLGDNLTPEANAWDQRIKVAEHPEGALAEPAPLTSNQRKQKRADARKRLALIKKRRLASRGRE